MKKHLIKAIILGFIVAVVTAGIITRRRGVADKFHIIENDIGKKVTTLKRYGVTKDNWTILDTIEFKVPDSSIRYIEIFIESNGIFFEYIAEWDKNIYQAKVDKKEIRPRNPIIKSSIKRSHINSLSDWENQKQYGV